MDTNENRSKKQRIPFDALVYLICCVGFLCLSYYFSGMKYVPKKDTDLAFISGKVSNRPVIVTDHKKRKTVAIYLEKYPDIEFLLAGDGYRGGNPEALTTIDHRGDSMTIGIAKNDYAKLSREPDYFKKHYVFIYKLSNNKNEYLSLDKYNELAAGEINDTRNFFPWVLIVVGLFLGSLGVRGIQKARKEA